MIDLESAIEREKCLAEMNREMADSFHTDENVYGREEEAYRNRAEYHQQLVNWLRAFKEIWDSGDCNDCLRAKNCAIRPKLGQLVRYNCYQYERKMENVCNPKHKDR